MTDVRKGQAPPMLGRDEFRLVFSRSFKDPSFKAVDELRAGRLSKPDRELKAPRPK